MSSATISAVAIPTRNRSAALWRAVRSYARAAQEEGRAVQFLIVDQSDRRHTRTRNERAAMAGARDHNCGCAYYGPHERAALSRRLAAQSGAPADVVDFALLGVRGPVATGALRNTILLATAGHAILQTDDDTTAHACRAPMADLASENGHQEGAFEMHFLSPRIDLNRESIWSDCPIFAAHEAVLGQGVKRQDASPKESTATTGQDHGSAERTGRRSGVVRMTQTGVIGDSGFGFPGAMLFLHGDARERLVASRRVYRAALVGSGTLRSYPRTVFCSSPFCMSTHFALDNRVIMPPFMPVGRNADGVFGWLFWRCSSDGLTAFLPLVIRHARPRDAAGRRIALVGASTCSSLLLQLMGSISSRGIVGTEAHLINVGVGLESLGRLRAAAFREFVRGQHACFVAAQAQRLQELLRSGSGLPRFWQDDIIAHLCALSEPPTRDDGAVCADLLYKAGDDHLTRLQQVVTQFGRLLQWWPQIWCAAADGRDQC